MKTRILLLLVPLMFLIGGCKKKSPLNAATAKLKTVTLNSPTINETYTLSYTSDNKLLLYQGSGGDKITYSYAGNTVTVNQYDTTGALSETDVYYLNSAGLADSEVLSYSGTVNYESFTYDANGYKIKMLFYDATNTLTEIYNWTITNGNATYYYYTDNLLNVMGTQTTTYLADKLSSTGNQNSGLSLFGNSSTNLAATAVVTGYTNASYTYTYTFDNNGLETSMTSTGTGGTYVWSYTYY
jgi:hypothetical protein